MDILKRTLFLKDILTDKEFNEVKNDTNAFNKSLEMYSEEYIDSIYIYSFNNNRFLINKNDIDKLHNGWESTLNQVSLVDNLLNPVYVEVDNNGELILD